MDARELLYGLSASLLTRVCRVSRDTARRWKRRGQVPPGMVALLELVAEGELGVLSPAWSGWRIACDTLVSPEGWRFTPGQVCAIPLRARESRELAAEVRALLKLFESESDQRRRGELYRELERSISSAIGVLEQLRALTCEAAVPEAAALRALASR